MSLSRRALLTTLAGTALAVTAPELATAAPQRSRLRWKGSAVSAAALRSAAQAAPIMAPKPGARVVPAAAKMAGFTRLGFFDDFTSTSTIDLSGKGAGGFSWYTAGVHAWGQSNTPAADLMVKDSVLTITPSTTNFNMNLSTADPNTGKGRTFGHGYFEARMKFPTQTAPAPMTNDGRFAWPAFWAESQAHIMGTAGAGGWGELDFFEACMGPNDFVGTVHDWRGGMKRHVQNANNATASRKDLSQWHTYGCLWQPGKVTWFLDGVAVHSQVWGAKGAAPVPYDAQLQPRSDAFGILDVEPSRKGMNVILGSGKGRPMSIDWVRIWTR